MMNGFHPSSGNWFILILMGFTFSYLWISSLITGKFQFSRFKTYDKKSDPASYWVMMFAGGFVSIYFIYLALKACGL
jgi:hypothetical protein